MGRTGYGSNGVGEVTPLVESVRVGQVFGVSAALAQAGLTAPAADGDAVRFVCSTGPGLRVHAQFEAVRPGNARIEVDTMCGPCAAEGLKLSMTVTP